MYISVLLACMYAHCICALRSWRSEEGNRYPRTRVTNCCRYWDLNLGPVRATSAVSPTLNNMDLNSFPGGLHYVVGFSFTAATLSYAYGFRLTLTVFS